MSRWARRSLIWICVALLQCVSGLASAQLSVKQLKLSAPIRHEHRLDRQSGDPLKQRIQYQLALRYALGLWQTTSGGDFNLQGLIGTGVKYTSQWNTLYDLIENETGGHPINVRQAFLTWTLQDWRVQLGVIPPVKGKVSATSIDKDGWIRGGRIVVPLGHRGQLEGVTGAIHRLEDPNAFQLWSSWNYAEVEWTQGWSERWRTELGYTQLEGENYLRAESRLEINVVPSVPVELAGDLLRNIASDVWAHDVSVTTWLGPVAFTLAYSRVPEGFGLLGALSNDFFTHGHLWFVSLGGPLWGPDGLYWFGQGYLGEEEVNLKLGVGYKVKYDG